MTGETDYEKEMARCVAERHAMADQQIRSGFKSFALWAGATIATDCADPRDALIKGALIAGSLIGSLGLTLSALSDGLDWVNFRPKRRSIKRRFHPSEPRP